MNRLLRFLRRTLVVLAVLIPVFGAVVVGWYRSHYLLLPEPKVNAVLPSPNGYDTLMAAANSTFPNGMAFPSPRQARTPYSDSGDLVARVNTW